MGTYNNTKAFFDYQNNLFVQQAKGVIDVSEWQGDIDWAKAKADGVEGVIIRLGHGWATMLTGKHNVTFPNASDSASRSASTGIPTRTFLSIAKEEGAGVVAKLKRFGVRASDLAYPVYYDLEKWTWKGHRPAHRSERVQRYRQQLVRRAEVRRIQETWASTRPRATCKAR